MNTKRRQNCQLWHDWKERIIRIGDEQTSLQNQFDNLRNDISDYPPRIAALETGVNALDGRLIIAESDIADAENRISACENDIDRLESEVDALDGRVTITESDIAEAEDRISACENDIDRIDAELVNKTGDINALANRVTLAEADIDDIDARLEGIETGNILLSQLVPDADKDMEGKTLSNVGIDANSLTVNGSKIEPSRVEEQFTLIDWQPIIDAEKLVSNNEAMIISYNDNNDIDMPFAKFVTIDSNTHDFSQIGPDVITYIGDTDGIYFTCYYKSGASTRNGLVAYVRYYDYNKQHIDSKWVTLPIILDNKWHKVTAKITKVANAVYCSSFLEIKASNTGLSFSGCRVHTNVTLDNDLSAKIISADGVVIKDGGTVDGVDVSTHTHDGTAVGGAKISYNNLEDKPDVAVATHNHDGTTVGGPKISFNNLVDKPTIPTKLSQLATDYNNQRVSAAKKAEWDSKADGSIFTPAKAAEWDGKARPPVPFRKMITISELTSNEYVMLDVLPPGRSSIMLTHIRVASFSTSGGGWIKPSFVTDDNTEAGMLATIDSVGDKAFDALRSNTDLSTKNAIKNIKFTVVGGGPITASLTCYGYIY